MLPAGLEILTPFADLARTGIVGPDPDRVVPESGEISALTTFLMNHTETSEFGFEYQDNNTVKTI